MRWPRPSLTWTGLCCLSTCSALASFFSVLFEMLTFLENWTLARCAADGAPVPGKPFAGLVDAPWVWTDDPESDDDEFFAALQELVAYAFEESVRIKKKGRLFPSWHEIPIRSSRGILQEVQSLLQKYRSELVRQSRLLDQGGRA